MLPSWVKIKKHRGEQLTAMDRTDGSTPRSAAQVAELMVARANAAEGSGRLSLNGLGLTEIPLALIANTKIADLVFLDLSDNYLTFLPEDFSAWDCIMTLVAKYNSFLTVPSCISMLECLTYLDLSGNELTELPEAMCELPLKLLLLTDNKISALPTSVHLLSGSLLHLDISRNMLRVLPPQLGHMRKLNVLKASGNVIDDFPVELCALNLRTLDLGENSLVHLPKELSRMRLLQNLKLSGNPLQVPPASIADKAIPYVFAWLDNYKPPVRTVKAIIVERTEIRTIAMSDVVPESKNGKQIQDAPPTTTTIPSCAAPCSQGTQTKASRLANGNETLHTNTAMGKDLHRTSAAVSPPLEDAKNNNSMAAVFTSITNVDVRTNWNSGPQEVTRSESKKPVSKVAPIVKGNARPLGQAAQNKHSSAPRKTSATTLPAKMDISSAKANGVSIMQSSLSKTNLTKGAKENRKSEESKIPRQNGSAHSTPSKTAASKPINEVEAARKLLRDKLGPSYAVNRGDVAFSAQLSDGVDLCRFLNKIHPDAVAVVTVAECTISANRSKQNAERFVQYCKKAGVQEHSLCSAVDILNRRNLGKVAKTVLSVSKLLPAQITQSNPVSC